MCRLFLSTILILFGCSGSPTVAVESAPLTSSQQADAVAELAYDPAFVAYAELAIQLYAQTTNVAASLPASARDAARASGQQIVADAKAPDATPAAIVPRVTELTSVTASQLDALRVRASAVLARFPNLDNTGPALLGQAMYVNHELRALVDASGGVENTELDDCLDDCLYEYTNAHNINIAIFTINIAICTGLVIWPPASALCFVEATADSFIAELQITADYDNCKDACVGIPPEGECHSDADCNSNQWCDTGTLGLGDNACKPDKAIGQVCSRDAKCLSGCCKFDFWQNPVSMTCNPSADCD